jgi:hypothetical protein
VAVADWVAAFKTNFPEFKVILDANSVDVTDQVLIYNLNIAMDMLPQGISGRFNATTLTRITDYMVAHLLTYFDVINNFGQIVGLMRNASNMAADGLSISYSDIAKMRNDQFASLNDFLNITSYGKVVAVYIGKITGSSGGFVI